MLGVGQFQHQMVVLAVLVRLVVARRLLELEVLEAVGRRSCPRWLSQVLPVDEPEQQVLGPPARCRSIVASFERLI
jgi:hypothetical protein